MPVNPFQTVAEMSWGQYDTKKSGRIGQIQTQQSLAGQGHRSQGWAPAAPQAELQAPRAEGMMPQGRTNLGRPNYGDQQVQQPQGGGRRASFGGMGAGAVKGGGGGGMTAGGDIKFDLSVGKTQTGDISGNVGSLGMGASNSDSMVGSTIDQSQTYSPRTTGSRGGSGTGGSGRSSTSGGSTPAKRAAKKAATPRTAANPRGSKPAGSAPASPRLSASGGSGRGGNAGDTMVDNSGVRFGNPTASVGRNRYARDTFSDQRNSRNTTTNNDNRKAAATPKPAAQPSEGPKNPSGGRKKKNDQPAATNEGPKNPSGGRKKKDDPKAESVAKETIKEKAQDSVENATKTPPAATKRTKKTSKAKKDEEE